MTIDALKRQLIREFRASPAKAIALLVLFCVGLYFWTPMVLRPLMKSPSSAVPAAAVASSPTAPTPPATSAASKPESGRTATIQAPWQDVAKHMDQDARMKSTALPAEARDPFAFPATDEVDVEIAKNVTHVPKLKITPHDVGLSVSSIALGPGGRTAMINGETIHEGGSIDAGDGITFDVVKVLPRRVLLARDGDEFELAAEREPINGIRRRKP